MLNIVLFGPPGAGKGTQSKKLIEKFHLVHLSTGDLLRREIAGNTSLGAEAKVLMDDGQLVPDELVIKMIRQLIEAGKSGTGFIFDGFPRTVVQAEALDELLHSKGYSISGMIELKVDKEELQHRLLLRGKESDRPDDATPEVVRRRIEEYEQKTAPVASYYRKQNKFYSVSGLGDIDEIFLSVMAVVKDSILI